MLQCHHITANQIQLINNFFKDFSTQKKQQPKSFQNSNNIWFISLLFGKVLNLRKRSGQVVNQLTIGQAGTVTRLVE